jgi:tetratricopeptide (TPR) repeat protein
MFRLNCPAQVFLVWVAFALLPAARGQEPKSTVPTEITPQATSGDRQTKTADSAGEDLVIEKLTTRVTFTDQGVQQQEQAVRIRIQSETGVKQWGVLSFPYRNDVDTFEVLEIQVRKPDGRVVLTPETNVQDLAAQVTRDAPTYSDLREKQVPVKALGVGDVLEWRSRITRKKPDIPGQFWFTHNFTKGKIVVEELLSVTVPSASYLKLGTSAVKSEIREEDGRRTYFWKTSCDQGRNYKEKADDGGHHRPDVQLTSFRNWQEVGQWYRGLEQSKAAVTPAIQAKADELTAGLRTDDEKLRAIYRFVTTKFRYISISFGVGRYQPHASEEVLSNQYGDCKDKHTLFAALLRAERIEAWAALIGSQTDIDADVPSPAPFDHLITYIPSQKLWLDTTPEVAPYGMLLRTLRDRQALVIPDAGSSSLMTTAKELPFPASEDIRIESKLGPNGTLTGHFDFTSRGDDEVLLRASFHSVPPAQWNELAQNMAAMMGYGGTVSSLDVDDPTSLDKAFHFSYDYERKGYSDWENRRITPPLPPFGLLPYGDDDRPLEAKAFGAPGKYRYRATVVVPEGYSVEIPSDIRTETSLADYSASYSVEKGVLAAERVFTVRVPKLAPEKWEEYVKFAKTVVGDESHFIQLVRAEAGATVAVARDVPEAAELVGRASSALQNHDFNTARDALAQAERLNPQQSNLWMLRALLYGMDNNNDKAIEALKKEIQYHPGNESTYRFLATAQRLNGQKEDAVDTLRRMLKVAPQSQDGVLQLASLLFELKKYEEAVEPLQAALKEHEDSSRIRMSLFEALIRGGQKEHGMAVLAEIQKETMDAETMNGTAWVLADTDTEPELANTIARKAVAEYESQLKDVSLSNLDDDQLSLVNSLAATWDTLGWAAFRSGDLKTAEPYVNAAWLLSQYAAVGDHLGQIYERQEKRKGRFPPTNWRWRSTVNCPIRANAWKSLAERRTVIRPCAGAGRGIPLRYLQRRNSRNCDRPVFRGFPTSTAAPISFCCFLPTGLRMCSSFAAMLN